MFTSTIKPLQHVQSHSVPHAVCPSTKLLANAGETGIEVLDQSRLDHLIRERQLQSPRHGDDVGRSYGVQIRLKLQLLPHNLPIFSGESEIRSLLSLNVATTFKIVKIKQHVRCSIEGHANKNNKGIGLVVGVKVSSRLLFSTMQSSGGFTVTVSVHTFYVTVHC